MSPSSTSSDFPCLTRSDNFDVWKTRIQTYRDGKNLLRFIENPNYELNPVVDDDDEDMVLITDDDPDSDFNCDEEDDSRDENLEPDQELDDDEEYFVTSTDVRRLTIESTLR